MGLQINILNKEVAEDEAMRQAFNRVVRHMHGAIKVDIHCVNRKPDGWLEYLLVFDYANGGNLTIGMVQRGLSRDFEFHT